jgi:hypothetical protein
MRRKTTRSQSSSSFVDVSDKEPTFGEWIYQKCHTAFVENMPLDSLKELPGYYLYIFGFLAYTAALTCFVYFVCTVYLQSMKQKFVSLDKVNDGAECEPVSREVGGTYYADFVGNWQGNNEFQYSNAPYRLDLTRFKSSNKEFKSFMIDVGENVTSMGSGAVSRDLAANLAYWMMWEVKLPYTKSINTFRMTGDPATVFQREFTFALMSNIQGHCLASPRVTTFDQSNFLLQLTYSVREFKADPICSDIATPELLGYVDSYDFDTFKLSLDVRSFIVAHGVGLNYHPNHIPLYFVLLLNIYTYIFICDYLPYPFSPYTVPP